MNRYQSIRYARGITRACSVDSLCPIQIMLRKRVTGVALKFLAVEQTQDLEQTVTAGNNQPNRIQILWLLAVRGRGTCGTQDSGTCPFSPVLEVLGGKLCQGLLGCQRDLCCLGIWEFSNVLG